jgi:surfeit locus 1 family protein
VKRRVLLSLLGLCLVLGFSALGRWQLGREQVKREQLAAAAAALAAPAVALERATGQGDGIQRVAGRARFLETPRLLLDNQRRGQRVGMRLYCAAQPASGAPLLVDLGWLPVDGARTLPVADCPRGEHVLAGLLVPPPSVGLRLGPGLVAQDRDWLAMRIEPAAVAVAWSLPAALSPRVLRLDPALPLGHERDLDLHANTLPPEKHRGYALQWFGLAATTFVLILVLNLRRRP